MGIRLKKKSNWGWGKKAEPRQPIDVDEPIDVPVYKMQKQKSPKSTTSRSKEFADRDWAQKQQVAERIAKAKMKKKKTKEDKRGVLIMKDYISFLHEKYGMGMPMEVHHWMPKGRIRHNDFFVCCLSPNVHYNIHHGDSTVNGFIEDRGIDNLLIDSAIMFAEWLATSSGRRHRHRGLFIAMIREIQNDPANYEYVLETTRRYAEEIRLLRR